ncbi:MAG TPA: glycerophosphodiester phosphodiesterase family protein, partial [Pseudomonadales bacterium]|nr:glycerophosphodiester phosphodiesterase family protein [Pseudomonadales bacterium]
MPAKLTEIVCHRGANQYAPENTRASAELCLAWGMDWLEIDVNTSRDGVMYLFHGPDLARTTNGTGKIYDHDSDVIDRLDCGSWFDASFAGEPVPRLEPFLRWIDHRIKIFFDVKYADLPGLVRLIHDLDMQDDCFFWFGREKFVKAFREVTRELALKINVRTPEDVIAAKRDYDAGIVELSLENMSQPMAETCEDLGVKTMILHSREDPDAFREILRWQVDMVNVDHGDVFLKCRNEFMSEQGAG